jgi:hypothetical protein
MPRKFKGITAQTRANKIKRLKKHIKRTTTRYEKTRQEEIKGKLVLRVEPTFECRDKVALGKLKELQAFA